MNKIITPNTSNQFSSQKDNDLALKNQDIKITVPKKSLIFNIGTRGSPLALAQAEIVKSLILQNAPDYVQCNIIKIQTSGDKFLGSALRDIGGKGLFTKEIEQSLLDEKIHVAVHSMKDVPTKRQDGLMLFSILPREDPREAFISHKFQDFASLPISAHIGTASLRRTAQLKRKRPDLRFSVLRGNVQTRLETLNTRKFDATLLAMAGLKRLGMEEVISSVFLLEELLPAPAQGAVGLEIRIDMDQERKDILKTFNCSHTASAVTAERGFLAALDGNCRTPIAAHAKISDGTLFLKGEFLSENGLKSIADQASGPMDKAFDIGYNLGIKVKEKFYKS